MPFKSKAQRRKFAQLLVEGRITDEQYEEWNRSTGTKTLPERIGAKRATKKATGKKATRKKATQKKAAPRKSSSARKAKRPARKTAIKRPARRKTPK